MPHVWRDQACQRVLRRQVESGRPSQPVQTVRPREVSALLRRAPGAQARRGECTRCTATHRTRWEAGGVAEQGPLGGSSETASATRGQGPRYSEVAGSEGHTYAVEGRAYLRGALRELLHGSDHGQPRRLEVRGCRSRCFVLTFELLLLPYAPLFRSIPSRPYHRQSPGQMRDDYAASGAARARASAPESATNRC